MLDSCLGTTAWMLGIAIILREATFFGRDVLPDAIGDWTATLPLVAALHPPFEPVDLASNAAVAVAAAATVTGEGHFSGFILSSAMRCCTFG